MVRIDQANCVTPMPEHFSRADYKRSSRYGAEQLRDHDSGIARTAPVSRGADRALVDRVGQS
jgi:hypothetical protein